MSQNKRFTTEHERMLGISTFHGLVEEVLTHTRCDWCKVSVNSFHSHTNKERRRQTPRIRSTVALPSLIDVNGARGLNRSFLRTETPNFTGPWPQEPWRLRTPHSLFHKGGVVQKLRRAVLQGIEGTFSGEATTEWTE